MPTLLIDDAARCQVPYGTLLIGRSGESDLVLPSGSVSRIHARLLLLPGQTEITDLGSSNGLSLQGRPIRHRLLTEDDPVRIGRHTVRVLESERMDDVERRELERLPSYASLAPDPSRRGSSAALIDEDLSGARWVLGQGEHRIGRGGEIPARTGLLGPVLSVCWDGSRHRIRRVGLSALLGGGGRVRLNGQPLTPRALAAGDLIEVSGRRLRYWVER